MPPDVQAIFEKLHKLLESDAEQNNTLPEPFKSQIAGGLNCDAFPNAHGDFGRAPSNPIPTNGPLGEVIYLSRLPTSAGSPVLFHRVRAASGILMPISAGSIRLGHCYATAGNAVRKVLEIDGMSVTYVMRGKLAFPTWDRRQWQMTTCEAFAREVAREVPCDWRSS